MVIAKRYVWQQMKQAEYLVGELRSAHLDVDEAYSKLIAYQNALLLISPSDELL